jgi:hypothetical protein
VKHSLIVIAAAVSFLTVVTTYAGFATPRSWGLDPKEWSSITSKAPTPGIPITYLQNKKYTDLKISYTRLEFPANSGCLAKNPCASAKTDLAVLKPEGLKETEYHSPDMQACQLQYQVKAVTTSKYFIYQAQTKDGHKICGVDTFYWQGPSRVLADPNKKGAVDRLYSSIRATAERDKTK